MLQIMNFNLLFSLLATQSFVLEFSVHVWNRQDYFFLEGDDQTAYLYRDNYTLGLHLSQGSNYSVYKTQIDQRNFIFSWHGFAVDGVEMTLSDAAGSIGDLKFNNFTFISPIVEVISYEGETECVYQLNDNVNYWYILLIVLVVSALFGSKTHSLGIAKRMAAVMRPNSSSFSQVLENEREIAVRA